MKPKLAILAIVLAATAASADNLLFPEVRPVDVPAVTRFGDWDGVPLVPAGTLTFFDIQMKANRDSSAVIAWGVDPSNNKILWRIALFGYSEILQFGNR